MSNILNIFPDILSFGNEDFFLKRDVNHALLKENRVGKSTHYKILTGVDHPDSDTIELTSEVVQVLLSQQSQEIYPTTVYQKVHLLINISKTDNIIFGKEPHYIVVLRDRPKAAEYTIDANDHKIIQTMAGDL